MDEDMRDELAQTERYVSDGMQLVLGQKELIATLEGDEAREAANLLAQFEEILARRIAERDRLRQLLKTNDISP